MRRADNLTIRMCQLSRNLGASNSGTFCHYNWPGQVSIFLYLLQLLYEISNVFNTAAVLCVCLCVYVRVCVLRYLPVFL